MPKDINILLIEDDPYARDLMGSLLTRDWRTRLVAEVGSEDDVRRIINIPAQRIDAIILDAEVPGRPDWPWRVSDLVQGLTPSPQILCTANHVDSETLKQVIARNFGGYLIKEEVGYALAAAVSQSTHRQRFILTPGVYRHALEQRVTLPAHTWLLDGTRPVADLTRREAEIARLAILFNHSHRDLSDELLIRADQVSKNVSAIYTKLGLDSILNGEVAPELLFEDVLVLEHFREILAQVAKQPSKRKSADMATLAFHILTQPEIREII